MSSNQASKIKKGGHDKEREFATLIGGKQVGTNCQIKEDVIKDQTKFTAKAGKKRHQWFLNGPDKLHEFGLLSELLLNIVKSCPPLREEYLDNTKKYKLSIAKAMLSARDKLSTDKNLLLDLWKLSLFGKDKVEYLAILDRDVWHIFYEGDVILAIIDEIKDIKTSKANHRKQFDDQKITFINSNGLVMAEIEVRKSTNCYSCYYPKLLFTSLVVRILPVLQKINKTEYLTLEGGTLKGTLTGEKMAFYGKAISFINKILGI